MPMPPNCQTQGKCSKSVARIADTLAPGYLHPCERQPRTTYTTLLMAEDRTSGKALTRTELLQKQKDGTLTQAEKILFLIKVRGMKASDAEAMIKHPPHNIITKDIIHLG